jgi:hypothetical protein
MRTPGSGKSAPGGVPRITARRPSSVCSRCPRVTPGSLSIWRHHLGPIPDNDDGPGAEENSLKGARWHHMTRLVRRRRRTARTTTGSSSRTKRRKGVRSRSKNTRRDDAEKPGARGLYGPDDANGRLDSAAEGKEGPGTRAGILLKRGSSLSLPRGLSAAPR